MFEPVYRFIVYEARSEMDGAVPESCHLMVTVPAANEPPAAGVTNLTSARAIDAAAQKERKVAKRIVTFCLRESPSLVLAH